MNQHYRSPFFPRQSIPVVPLERVRARTPDEVSAMLTVRNDATIRVMWKAGNTFSEICEAVDRVPGYVRSRVKAMGLPVRTRHLLVDESEKAAIDEAIAKSPGMKMAEVLDIVCTLSGMSAAIIIGPQRSVWVARPRQVVCWATHSLRRYSLPQIGRLLGNRDHTTILHAVSRCNEVFARNGRVPSEHSLVDNIGWLLSCEGWRA